MPFITDELLYVHMPKTGGLWISRILQNVAKGIRIPGLPRHTPAMDIPEEYLEDRLMFGSIRDPWSWYTSLWQHLRAGEDGQQLLAYLDDGEGTFTAFLRGATYSPTWMRAPKHLTQKLLSSSYLLTCNSIAFFNSKIAASILLNFFLSCTCNS